MSKCKKLLSVLEEHGSNTVCLAKIIFANLFYYSVYLCYYSWVSLYFFILFTNHIQGWPWVRYRQGISIPNPINLSMDTQLQYSISIHIQLLPSLFIQRQGWPWVGYGSGIPIPYPKYLSMDTEYQYPLISILDPYPDLLSMDIHTLPKTHLKKMHRISYTYRPTNQ